ncbi:MAG: hypothetical protein KIS86_13420 [Devosia sp.]|nr:hypothetical protein [Devosia sp.]
MKKLIWLLGAYGAMVLLPGLPVAFELDVPIQELLQRTDRLTVMDLAVGEVGIVTLPSYCHEGEKVFAHGMLVLSEGTNSLVGAATRFKRLPNSLFEVTIADTSTDRPLEYWLANTGLSASITPCEGVSGLPSKVEISTINGAKTLRELLPLPEYVED